MNTLDAKTVEAIFEAMPIGEWVTYRDVWLRLGVGAPSTVGKGLNHLMRTGRIDGRLEFGAPGHPNRAFYLRDK